MIVKTISVVYGRKFNLGNFESAEIACTLWADIEPEEDESERLADLYEIAKESVKEQALPLVKDRPSFKTSRSN